MTLWLDDGDVRLHHGDCLEVMRELDADSIDAVVTDPPYGLGFMGQAWDAPRIAARAARLDGGERDHTKTRERAGAMHAGEYDLRPSANREFQAWCEAWAVECLRVLKPGGHLLSFGGTRTYHRLTSGIEDAGFEIRDCLVWLYGSGFPKSLEVSKAIDKAAGAERAPGAPRVYGDGQTYNGGAASGRSGGAMGDRVERGQSLDSAPATPDAEQWQGWGTALKPAHEPIVLARKPLVGTVAANVLAHGTGALNIDACRIEGEPQERGAPPTPRASTENWRIKPGIGTTRPEGRWPANVVLDDEAAAMLDAETGELASSSTYVRRSDPTNRVYGAESRKAGTVHQGYGDPGGASRFFYCAKAASSERNDGLHGVLPSGRTMGHKRCAKCGRQKVNMPGSACACVEPEWIDVEAHAPRANSHPTVKPVDLMRWLVRLVTPPGGVVLDPFAGSGTTGVACRAEHVRCVLIEREEKYLPIIAGRLSQLSLFTSTEGRLSPDPVPHQEASACPHATSATSSPGTADTSRSQP